MTRLVTALFLATYCSGVAWAETWLVPDQFVTIQGAIDASADADTILVRPGTYVENLLILGKSIALQSLGGQEVTVIDGSFPPRPDTLSVVCALGAENLLVAGFTIVNGLGSSLPDLTGVGGGMALIGCGGEVRNCIIRDNHAEYDGGGVYLFGSTVNFSGCSIQDNECGRNGGGLTAFFASPRLENCTIMGNRGGDGGAAYMSLGTAEYVECEIYNNLSDSGWVLNGLGRYEQTLVVSNGFTDPSAPSRFGILTSDRIDGCTIAHNQSWRWTVVLAGEMSRSIVAFNDAQGVWCDGDAVIACSNVFANGGGDDLCGTDPGGNFSLEPMFCADYSLAESSPCAPANAPVGCGLIGARDVGCTGAIEASTWGRIKARYRD